MLEEPFSKNGVEFLGKVEGKSVTEIVASDEEVQS